MEGFLTILALFVCLLPILLVIGLIKPKVVLFWSKKPTRLKVVGWWLLLEFVFFIAFGLLNERFESNKTPEEIISSSKKDIDDGDYNTAIERLKRIAPEDSLYTYAQELIGRADSLSKEEVLNKAIKEIKDKNYDAAIRRLEKIAPANYGSSLLRRAKLLSHLKESNLTVLTVKDIIMSHGVKVRCFDEKYEDVVMPDNPSQWFNNVSTASATIPKGQPWTGNRDGDLVLLGKALFEFNFDGKNYSWNIGTGSEFIVQKTDRGTYKLYPEETIELLE